MTLLACSMCPVAAGGSIRVLRVGDFSAAPPRTLESDPSRDEGAQIVEALKMPRLKENDPSADLTVA